MARVKPDAIVTWPASCDYPLWRDWVERKRDTLGRVIVAFSPSPGHHSYVREVTELMAGLDVTFLDTRWEDGWDWRDAAVNSALARSDSEWVWFTEQDFWAGPEVWRTVEARQHCADAMGFRIDERWHPCSLYVRRTYVDRTERYFGSDPVDHFYTFGIQLVAAGARFVDLDCWVPPTSYRHMQGLSHNHELVSRGIDVTFKPDEFAWYLRRCLARCSTIPRWEREAREWLAWYAASREVD